MVKRRSLTPSKGAAKGDVHATRRGSGGARKEVTDRVVLREGAAELSGWALNESRGGIRIILEDRVELGHQYEVEMGHDGGNKKRRGRVVWVQEENDGMIVGLEFVSELPPSQSVGSEAPGPSEPPLSAEAPSGGSAGRDRRGV
jgi:PilZ domain-containing protein